MPAETLAARPATKRRKIAVRKISDEDLSWALKSGLHDFGAMRGDLVFVGLLYPVVGFIAAAMTTNGSLLPLFFPVAAGIGLLGPVAAVGFYELARRREDGQTSNWSHFFDVRKRETVDDMGVVAGMLLAIFARLGAGRGRDLSRFVRPQRARPDHGFRAHGLHHAARLGADRHRRRGRRCVRLDRAGISVVSLPLLVDRNVTTAEAVSASWRAANAQQRRDDPLGTDRHRASGARLDPAVHRARVRAAVARLFDLAPLHPAGRPGQIARPPPQVEF